MHETTRASPSGPALVMPMIQKRTPSAGAQPDPRLASIRVDATNVILKEHDRVFSQGDLADAESAEVRARADYNKALSQLHFAEGSLLERNKLVLELK